MPRLAVAVVLGLALAATGHAAAPEAQREVLTLPEAAALLRLPTGAVASLARRKDLPGRNVGGSWRFSRQAILCWLGGDNAGACMSSSNAAPVAHGRAMPPSSPPAARVDAGEVSPPSGTPATQPVRQLGPKPDDAAKPQDIAMRDTKLLLKPGQWLLEPTLSFERFDRQVLAMATPNLLTLASERYRNTTAGFILRRGGSGDSEFSFGMTRLHENMDTLVLDQSIGASTYDQTMLSFGMRKQIWNEGQLIPGGILDIRFNAPTAANQTRSLGAGMTFAKSIDPTVMSASLLYWRSFVGDENDLMHLTARDRISASLGYGIVLNDAFAANFSLSGDFQGRTAYSKATLPAAESFRLNMGFHYTLTREWSMEPTLSFGLAGIAQSATFGVTFPYLI